MMDATAANDRINLFQRYIQSLFSWGRQKVGESPTYVPITEKPLDAATLAIRAIAFYLPQFHPIPENDAWWGKGFTEWTNVTRAVPLFQDHYQPRLPGELGFYDLRVPSVMQRQVELAKLYGLSAFCFHYYWFGGKRILEYPLEQFLNTPSLDFGFCINFANENWSRRWDGSEHEILLEQKHSPEDDCAMMRDACRYFRDPRYVRIEGKPVFLMYRTDLFPDVKATINRWRETARAEGVGEIFVVMVRFLKIMDLNETGADASMEFPPHGAKTQIDHRGFVLNAQYDGVIYDYRSVINNSCAQTPETFGHTCFRGVMPGWDNCARRPDTGHIYYGNTPDLYRMWLTQMCDYTVEHYPPTHNLVFINAWNEWAEAAYLEPDRRNGYAYLQATAEALGNFES